MEGNDIYIYLEHGRFTTSEEIDKELDRITYGSWYTPRRIIYEISRRMNGKRRRCLENEND